MRAGVLEKIAYQARPTRFDYKLTRKGRDLWPVLTALRQWGDRYAAPGGPPLQIVHRRCGHVTEVVATCGECGERIGPRDVTAVAGRGARRDDHLTAGVTSPR